MQAPNLIIKKQPRTACTYFARAQAALYVSCTFGHKNSFDIAAVKVSPILFNQKQHIVHSPVLSFPVNRLIQQLIDASVHEVISTRYVNKQFGAFGKCAVYAIVGAKVLEILTGEHCQAVCGGQIMDCGRDKFLVIAPSRREISSAKNLSDIRMYHCWIQVYLMNQPKFDPIVIDFTTRYDQLSAALLGVQFAIEQASDFTWCRLSDFDRAIPMSVAHPIRGTELRPSWLWRNAKCEVLLERFRKDNVIQFSAITSDVLLNFADRIEKLHAQPELANQ